MDPAKIMGIVNVTPDSFSDGGEFLDPEKAIAHGRELAKAGADILDIGGESTRPGADAVDAGAELLRVQPVIEALASDETPISIDTRRRSSREAARCRRLDGQRRHGAPLDPGLAAVCAETGCDVVLMHMLGDPRTMQENPVYDDVVDDIKAFLAERIEFAVSQGIDERRIWVDPGIGFGKTVEHNLELHRRLGEFAELGRPISFGSSRKSFIGKLTGAEVDQRVGGTIASNVIAYANGARMLRVHDVGPMRQALTIAEAILDR
jgi:dihydropteroate synthase